MGFMMHKVGLEQVRNRISRFLYTSKKKSRQLQSPQLEVLQERFELIVGQRARDWSKH